MWHVFNVTLPAHANYWTENLLKTENLTLLLFCSQITIHNIVQSTYDWRNEDRSCWININWEIRLSSHLLENLRARFKVKTNIMYCFIKLSKDMVALTTIRRSNEQMSSLNTSMSISLLYQFTHINTIADSSCGLGSQVYLCPHQHILYEIGLKR